MGTEDDDRHRMKLHHPLDRVQPVDPRQLEIHRHKVGGQPGHGLQRLLARRADADYFDAVVALEKARQSPSVGGGVLADEDTRSGEGGSHAVVRRWTVSSSSCWSKSPLAMYASAPASMPLRRSS